MNRRRFLLATTATGLAVATAEAPGFGQKPERRLAVSVLISERTISSGNRRQETIPVLRLGTLAPHLSVILQNTSSELFSLWDEDCSWGFDNLHLAVMAVEGKPRDKPIIVARGGVGWGGNAPKASLLPAGAMVVREVEFAPRVQNKETRVSAWWYYNFPLPVHPTCKIRLRAVYSVEATEAAKQGKVWTGRIASPTQDYLVKQIFA